MARGVCCARRMLKQPSSLTDAEAGHSFVKKVELKKASISPSNHVTAIAGSRLSNFAQLAQLSSSYVGRVAR